MNPAKIKRLLQHADADLSSAIDALQAVADATGDLDLQAKCLAAQKTADAARETTRDARLVASMSGVL